MERRGGDREGRERRWREKKIGKCGEKKKDKQVPKKSFHLWRAHFYTDAERGFVNGDVIIPVARVLDTTLSETDALVQFASGRDVPGVWEWKSERRGCCGVNVKIRTRFPLLSSKHLINYHWLFDRWPAAKITSRLISWWSFILSQLIGVSIGHSIPTENLLKRAKNFIKWKGNNLRM